MSDMPIIAQHAVAKTHKSKEVKIFNSLRYVVIAYIIFWTPYFIQFDVGLFSEITYSNTFLVYVFCSWLFYTWILPSIR